MAMPPPLTSPLWPLLASPFVGSFAGVLIRRLPAERARLWGRSECPTCRRPLGVLRSGAVGELRGTGRALPDMSGADRVVPSGGGDSGAIGGACGGGGGWRLARLRARLDAARAGLDRRRAFPAAGRSDLAAGRWRGWRQFGRWIARRPPTTPRRRSRATRRFGCLMSPIAVCAGATDSARAMPSCSRQAAPGWGWRRFPRCCCWRRWPASVWRRRCELQAAR